VVFPAPFGPRVGINNFEPAATRQGFLRLPKITLFGALLKIRATREELLALA